LFDELPCLFSSSDTSRATTTTMGAEQAQHQQLLRLNQNALKHRHLIKTLPLEAGAV
jgi:hypothetical protein